MRQSDLHWTMYILILLVLASAVHAQAVYSSSFPVTAPGFYFPWEVAVDSSSNIYVGGDGNLQDTINKYFPSGSFIGSIPYYQPYYGLVTYNDILYQIDGNKKNVTAFDVSLNTISVTPSLATPSEVAQGIAVDSSGIYAVFAITGINTVKKYSLDGKTLLWSVTPPNIPANVYLNGIAVGTNGVVYVGSEYFVYRLNANTGGYIDRWGAASMFQNIVALAADVHNNVYVLDYTNSDIQVFDPLGNFKERIGSKGSAPGQFNNPHGIAVDTFGNIYVADTSNSRIEKFTQSNFCNNGIKEGTEVCDRSNNSQSCDSLIGPRYIGPVSCNTECVYDTTGCYIPPSVCGNGIIEFGEECELPNVDNCEGNCMFKKIPGWTASIPGTWRNTSSKLVWTNISGTSLIYDTYLSIKANTPYTLSVSINNPTNCNAYADLDDGNCLNFSSQKYLGTYNDACFIDSDATLSAASSTSGWQSLSRSIMLTPKFSNLLTSEGYFKNVKLRLVVDGTCNPGVGVMFDDILLKDAVDQIDKAHYDAPQSVDDALACCPTDWCWDGKTCIPSSYWMNNSQNPPIWNNIFNTSVQNWTDGHVNSTSNWRAIGYRCISDNLSNAEWRPAMIKYDWDFEQSGYCNRPNDCFVNKDFNRGDAILGQCVLSGETARFDKASNTYYLGGTHYCDNGTWTTKTAIVANVLVNLYPGHLSEYPYVLLCDDNIAGIFNNVSDAYKDATQDVVGACTIIYNVSNEDVVVSGILLDENTETPGNVLVRIRTKYIESIKQEPAYDPDAEIIKDNLADCVNVSSDNNYSTCSDDPKIKIYYNKQFNFFLISTKELTLFENKGFFQNIWDFFVGLFRTKTPPVPTITIINKTSNFNKIFIINNVPNNYRATRGIEESKYDENSSTLKYLLYIQYNGTTESSNQITPMRISYYINPEYISYDPTTGNNQVLIVQTNRTASGLWPYLTAMLRIRESNILS